MPSCDWDARDYQHSSAVQQQWALDLLDVLKLQSDERLLDLGCGDGKVTAEIAGRLTAGSVVGIDSSAAMVELASRTFPATTYPNLSFQLADAAALPFTNEFDVVFSSATLHWVADHQRVLAGIRNSLRPGGRLLLQMGGAGNAEKIFAVVSELSAEPSWRSYFADFTFPYAFHGPADYAVWLPEAGLAPQRLELIPKDMVHSDRDALAGWIRTTWLPYTQRLPEGNRDEFIAELVNRYLASHPVDTDGATHVLMQRLEVAATWPGPARWFVFQGDRLLVEQETSAESARGTDVVSLPQLSHPSALDLPISFPHFLGSLADETYFAAACPEESAAPAGRTFQVIRRLFDGLPEPVIRLAGRAYEVVNWDRTSLFCGSCGATTRRKSEELAKVCPGCGQELFPRVAPAVIVAVVKGDELLLARSPRFPGEMYSVLAGFVEPGETLEECVRREVREEVGIEVDQIEYFGSQPWPFPNSLMVAFTARHAGGEIAVDGREIIAADWYCPSSLPRIPGKQSIARRLIDWFVGEYG
ncbi:MAG: NAD(+) diphosphatase [bacterium]